MKGDFSRDSFRRERHYSGVRMQQGRVQLDADWNEQATIAIERERAQIRDIVGRVGAPKAAPGFTISAAGDDLRIAAGRIYLDGLLCVNDRDALYSQQPFGSPEPLDQANGLYLVYLDAWERLVTVLEDPALREVALGGPDTTARTQVVWRVRLERLPADAPTTCEEYEDWRPAQGQSTGTLAARARPPAIPPDPCTVGARNGYTRAENQLYRVEIHSAGPAGSATYKWARDNASVAAAWDGTDGSRLMIGAEGRDEHLSFATGEWLELVDEGRESNGIPGELASIAGVSGTTLTIAGGLGGARAPSNFPLNPRVRRWDSQGALAVPADSQFVRLVDALGVDDGIEVQFDPAGSYASGDYWLIPARTLINDVIWPEQAGAPAPLPRNGPQHAYGALAIARRAGRRWSILSSCVPIFPPLTEISVPPAPTATAEGCCIGVRPGESLRDAIELAVASGGGCICLAPGRHVVDGPLTIFRATSLTISGAGEATVLQLDPDSSGAGGILIEGSSDTTLADMTIVGALPALVELRSAGQAAEEARAAAARRLEAELQALGREVAAAEIAHERTRLRLASLTNDADRLLARTRDDIRSGAGPAGLDRLRNYRATLRRSERARGDVSGAGESLRALEERRSLLQTRLEVLRQLPSRGARACRQITLRGLRLRNSLDGATSLPCALRLGDAHDITIEGCSIAAACGILSLPLDWLPETPGGPATYGRPSGHTARLSLRDSAISYGTTGIWAWKAEQWHVQGCKLLDGSKATTAPRRPTAAGAAIQGWYWRDCSLVDCQLTGTTGLDALIWHNSAVLGTDIRADNHGMQVLWFHASRVDGCSISAGLGAPGGASIVLAGAYRLRLVNSTLSGAAGIANDPLAPGALNQSAWPLAIVAPGAFPSGNAGVVSPDALAAWVTLLEAEQEIDAAWLRSVIAPGADDTKLLEALADLAQPLRDLLGFGLPLVDLVISGNTIQGRAGVTLGDAPFGGALELHANTMVTPIDGQGGISVSENRQETQRLSEQLGAISASLAAQIAPGSRRIAGNTVRSAGTAVAARLDTLEVAANDLTVTGIIRDPESDLYAQPTADGIWLAGRDLQVLGNKVTAVVLNRDDQRHILGGIVVRLRPVRGKWAARPPAAVVAENSIAGGSGFGIAVASISETVTHDTQPPPDAVVMRGNHIAGAALGGITLVGAASPLAGVEVSDNIVIGCGQLAPDGWGAGINVVMAVRCALRGNRVERCGDRERGSFGITVVSAIDLDVAHNNVLHTGRLDYNKFLSAIELLERSEMELIELLPRIAAGGGVSLQEVYGRVAVADNTVVLDASGVGLMLINQLGARATSFPPSFVTGIPSAGAITPTLRAAYSAGGMNADIDISSCSVHANQVSASTQEAVTTGVIGYILANRQDTSFLTFSGNQGVITSPMSLILNTGQATISHNIVPIIVSGLRRGVVLGNLGLQLVSSSVPLDPVLNV